MIKLTTKENKNSKISMSHERRPKGFGLEGGQNTIFNLDELSIICSYLDVRTICNVVCQVCTSWNDYCCKTLSSLQVNSGDFKIHEFKKFQSFVTDVSKKSNYLSTVCIRLTNEDSTLLRNQMIQLISKSTGFTVKRLELQNAKMMTMDNGFSYVLKYMPNIVHLNLSGCWHLNDTYMSNIAESFPLLEHLDISKCFHLTAFLPLLKLKSLKVLKMNSCIYMNLNVIDSLSHLELNDHKNQNMQELQAYGLTGIGNGFGSVLSLFPNLKTLLLGYEVQHFVAYMTKNISNLENIPIRDYEQQNVLVPTNSLVKVMVLNRQHGILFCQNICSILKNLKYLFIKGNYLPLVIQNKDISFPQAHPLEYLHLHNHKEFLTSFNELPVLAKSFPSLQIIALQNRRLHRYEFADIEQMSMKNKFIQGDKERNTAVGPSMESEELEFHQIYNENDQHIMQLGSLTKQDLDLSRDEEFNCYSPQCSQIIKDFEYGRIRNDHPIVLLIRFDTFNSVVHINTYFQRKVRPDNSYFMGNSTHLIANSVSAYINLLNQIVQSNSNSNDDDSNNFEKNNVSTLFPNYFEHLGGEEQT